jgi:hypothetical protein
MMRDPQDAGAEEQRVPAGTDSHAGAPKPRRKRAIATSAGKEQKALDARAEIPLHVRPVLNGYAEVAAVGICSERALRRHIATGRVKKAVIRNGRNLRFVVRDLLDELRQAED